LPPTFSIRYGWFTEDGTMYKLIHSIKKAEGIAGVDYYIINFGNWNTPINQHEYYPIEHSLQTFGDNVLYARWSGLPQYKNPEDLERFVSAFITYDTIAKVK
jgi:hypothetical protein